MHIDDPKSMGVVSLEQEQFLQHRTRLLTAPAPNRRAGELTAEEVERLVTIIQNPRQFKVPDWMLNRKKDTKDGKFSQVVSNTLDMKLREDLERMKKIRAHRGLRHYCAFRPARWPVRNLFCRV